MFMFPEQKEVTEETNSDLLGHTGRKAVRMALGLRPLPASPLPHPVPSPARLRGPLLHSPGDRDAEQPPLLFCFLLGPELKRGTLTAMRLDRDASAAPPPPSSAASNVHRGSKGS